MTSSLGSDGGPGRAGVPPVARGAADPLDQRLAAVIALAADAVVLVDGSQRITGFNEGAEKAFGYPASDVMGQPLEMLLPDRHRLAHREHMARFEDGPETARRMGERLGIVGLRRDGSEFPAEASIAKLSTPDGGVTFLAILRDVTEQRSRERQLAQAQKLAGVGSWEWDVTTNRVSWSDELYRIYGVTPGSVTLSLETFLERVIPEDREHTRANVEAAIATLDPFDFEERIVRPDGSIRVLRSRGEVLADARGRPVRLIGVCQDITDQRRMEERARQLAGERAAREESERLARRLERVQNLTSELSRARTVDEVAEVVLRNALDLLEADRGGVALLSPDGASFEMISTRGYPARVTEPYRVVPVSTQTPAGQAVLDRAPVWVTSPEDYEARFAEVFRATQATTRTHALAALPVHNREGAIIGLVTLGFPHGEALGIVDRTLTTIIADQVGTALDRALVFDRERAGRREAESQARVREEALAVVAHELRNPLNVIATNAVLLKEGVLGPDRSGRLIELSERAVAQMDRLISDLLDVARIEAGRLPIEPAPASVRRLVSDAVDPFRDQAQANGVVLEVDLDQAPAQAVVDRDRFCQLLGNLLSNAIKHAPRGSAVRVALRDGDGSLRGTVADEGPGIAVDEQPHLFERYWQARSADRRRGVGLGLAIAKGIVEAHGGSIGVDSTPGEGATFWFELGGA